MNQDEIYFQEIDHINVNQPDLEYCISLIDGELAQIYAINHRERAKCGHLLMQQIEEAVKNEAEYRANQRIEDHE